MVLVRDGIVNVVSVNERTEYVVTGVNAELD